MAPWCGTRKGGSTPLKVRTWGYLCAEAVDSIRKNGVMSLASVSTVALSLFILSVFMVVAMNLRHMSTTLESQIQVVAYLHAGADQTAREDLMDEVSRLPGVAEVRFVGKDEALDRLKRQFGDQADLLEAVEANNPLRDSLEARVPDPAQVDSVAAYLKDNQGVEKVVYQRETVRRLHNLTSALRALGLFLAALLAAGTLFIISNTIRLSVFARRREIGIMKLVGATDGFIRWPFLVEGAILGLLGAAVAAMGLNLGYGWLTGQVTDLLPFIPLVPRQPFMTDVTRGLLALGALVGAGGSVLSVRRHLKV